ncbi:hypothetical protein OESDEN_01998 [Oesophagostomum dentatum]|uniref:Uncharacterized protein n=1 Tax=Oesophagostomum dentatum TaxID=61180 RepID=A0A0B1TL80_OESDE|nr:hypothetical protein OESDEN_01998 [Oesophagostomum dentatum]
MQNLAQLSYPEKGHSTRGPSELMEYPAALRPFINATAVSKKGQRNATEDDVITDEDVADISDDDDEIHKVNKAHYDGKKMTVTLSTEAGIELYQHWLDQARTWSNLFRLENVPEYMKAAHQSCAKEAKTVQSHAQCVVVLLDAEVKYQKWNAKFGNAKHLVRLSRRRGFRNRLAKRKNGKDSERTRQYYDIKSFRKNKKQAAFHDFSLIKYEQDKHNPKKKILDLPPKEYFPSESGWVGSFKMRAKRAINGQSELNTDSKRIQTKPVQQNNYNLLQEHKLSPLALLAKKLVHTVRTFKNKDKEYKSWKEVVSEIKAEGKKLKEKQRIKKLLQQRFDLFRRTLRDQGVDKTLIKKMNVLDDDDEDDNMESMMLKAKEQEQTMNVEDEIMRTPVKLIREGMKLGMIMSGHNVTNFDRQTVKLISPRLFSLVPDGDDDAVSLLSPSLLSLHNEGRGVEAEMSLAKAFNLLDDQGHEEWLNFVIEASGVSDAVLKMKDANAAEETRQMDERYRGKDGQPMYFTKENLTEMYGPIEGKKADVIEKLQHSLSHQQLLEMNSTGYTVMTPQQLEMIYGYSSPYADLTTYERLKNVSASEIPQVVDNTIRSLAQEVVQFKAQRKKDITLTPLVLMSVIRDPALISQPLVLSPVLMVPVIWSPAVFGPVILSPWAFVPVLVSPRVLCPVVLSPILLSPVVLTPLALDPLILSPGALAPFVLSPLVLSPFVLSPVALAPLILTPFCLSPFILIANVLSPLILSPFVLSPLILSPVALSAFVLTPYVLSPVLGSPGTFFSAVLSPTWLS